MQDRFLIRILYPNPALFLTEYPLHIRIELSEPALSLRNLRFSNFGPSDHSHPTEPKSLTFCSSQIA
ncbi:hypothetical protein ACTXT7_010245 [Hymenolepis weldensis]